MIEPAFAKILSAKHLEAIPRSAPGPACPAELRIPLEFLISAQGPSAPATGASDQEAIVDHHQAVAARARPVDEDDFRIPDYSRPPPGQNAEPI